MLTSDEQAAYQALRQAVAVVDLPVHWSQATGPQVFAALNGLVTNDVVSLTDGHGVYAAALSAKGKLLCDLAILREDATTARLLMPPACAEPWFAMTRKFVNPRLARLVDDHTEWQAVVLAGPSVPMTVAQVTGGAVSAEAMAGWKPWQHAAVTLDGLSVRVVRTAWLGACPTVILLARRGEAQGLSARVTALGLPVASAAVWEVARVEAGRPAFGIDMTDDTLAQEAILDTLDAISFTKGCYTGQETVARVHFRGHVNRLLRGVRRAVPMPRGALLQDGTGKLVGDLRTSVVSPTFGPIALAMVRREVEVGQPLTAHGADAARAEGAPAGGAQTEGAGVMAELFTLPFSR